MSYGAPNFWRRPGLSNSSTLLIKNAIGSCQLHIGQSTPFLFSFLAHNIIRSNIQSLKQYNSSIVHTDGRINLLVGNESNANKERRGVGIPRLLKLEHEHTWITVPRVSEQATRPAAGQLLEPTTVTYDNKTMAVIMGVVVIVFFVSGFVSLYGRQCGNRRRLRGPMDLTFPMGLPRSSSRAQGRGVNQEIIQSFPTFVYSTVKGRGALACAVCLNEYEDDETLRLIPRCSHVFHPECIDGWLKSHYTCPLCRANLLVPVAVQSESEATPLVAVEIADSEEEEHVNGGERRNVGVNRSRTVREEGGPSRSRSTGLVMGILFGRSRSTGERVGETWERYTLRWEEVKRLKRAKSCVTFTRMSSGRRGYRTRSVGSNQSHSRFITSQSYTFLPFNFKLPPATPSSSP